MNQARLRGLQVAVGAQAGTLTALGVSDPGNVEERATRGAAAAPVGRRDRRMQGDLTVEHHPWLSPPDIRPLR